jgi:hypothetical protein
MGLPGFISSASGPSHGGGQSATQAAVHYPAVTFPHRQPCCCCPNGCPEKEEIREDGAAGIGRDAQLVGEW